MEKKFLFLVFIFTSNKENIPLDGQSLGLSFFGTALSWDDLANEFLIESLYVI